MSVTLSILKQRSDFLAAARSGLKCAQASLIVQVRARGDTAEIRLGYTATKALGNAVVRSRVKRRLRAAAVQLVPELGCPGCDYVFIGRTGAYKGTFDDLIRDMKHALKRIADSVASAAK